MLQLFGVVNLDIPPDQNFTLLDIYPVIPEKA